MKKCLVILGIILCIATTSLLTVQDRKTNTNDDEVKILIGVSEANMTEPWRVVMTEEIKEEAIKHKDVRVIFTDAAQSTQKQINDVNELLQEGIDLLIISPNDAAALTPVVANVYQKIPVIVLDRAVEGYDYTLYIGPDNRSIGRQAGRYIAGLLGAKGGNVIEIQGLYGSPPVRDRSIGFHEIIEKYPNIKIIDSIVADWQRDKAEDEMKKVLNNQTTVDVVFAQNDPMALGANKAAENRVNGIKFVGVDGLMGPNGGLQLVADGILTGTFTCPPGGREAVRYAIDILNHEKGIPQKIILRSNKITKENVSEYLSAKNEVLDEDDNKKITLGFSQLGHESEWRAANSESIKTAALDKGIDLIFLDADQKQEDQKAAIKAFIKQKVDVIAFAPVVADGWDDVLKEAKIAGIPVIIIDRTINVGDESLYMTYIGADFMEEGRRAARWLVNKMQGRDRVNIVELQGTIGSAPAIDRKKGFAEIIKDYPQFKIIESETGDFTKASGKAIMEKFLQRDGANIDAVFAHNDDMALGAIEAIEDNGLKPGEDIIIVSVDAARGAFNAMMVGKLNCTVECNPLLGPQLMKAVKALISGRQLPVEIITEEGVFSQEVARYELPNRKY